MKVIFGTQWLPIFFISFSSLSLLAFLCYEIQRCMELTKQPMQRVLKKVSVQTFSISEQSTINCYVNESWECSHDSRDR